MKLILSRNAEVGIFLKWCLVQACGQCISRFYEATLQYSMNMNSSMPVSRISDVFSSSLYLLVIHTRRCAGSPPFSFPVFTYWGSEDRRVKEDHVKGWKKFFSGDFSCEEIQGNHLWPLDKAKKTLWLDKIVVQLDKLI
jgi:hypothetical protein